MVLHTASISILKLYYPHVSKLSDFILLTLRDVDRDAFAGTLVLDSDHADYKKLLSDACVGCSLEAASPGCVSLDLLGNGMGSVR